MSDVIWWAWLANFRRDAVKRRNSLWAQFWSWYWIVSPEHMRSGIILSMLGGMFTAAAVPWIIVLIAGELPTTRFVLVIASINFIPGIVLLLWAGWRAWDDYAAYRRWISAGRPKPSEISYRALEE